MIGYTCKYTPIEIFNGFDEECVLINSAAQNFEHSQNLMHSNVCSHVKAILEEINNGNIDNFVFVNCCDSLRRCYDVVKNRLNGFVFFMDLPHNDNECAVNVLKSELIRLVKEFEKHTNKKFDLEKFKNSFNANKQDNSQNYIAVLGARCEDILIENIEKLSPLKIEDKTCSKNRNISVFFEENCSFEEVMEEYARAILFQTPCMRMTDINSRKSLYNDEKIKGIIYHTVKFCDYYDFEYKDLAEKISVPTIKIETDYTVQSQGQLSTRLEAFFETIEKSKKTSEKVVAKGGKYFAGIDSGSTTTNLAVIDEKGNLVYQAIVRTGFNAKIGAEKALEKAGVKQSDISYIVATGYGRKNIPFANDSVTEITCHARGANYLCPDAKIIIDIGGQDSKVIALDEKGKVINFVMNDKCAAGTGRFLENMARVLELDIEKMAKMGLNYKEDLDISSMCTVFAESEVVSLIAENKNIDDIIHALNKSVAVKINSLVKRVNTDGSVIMTGGVGRNKGVVKEIEKVINKKVFVPENPDLCGAIGAALFARDNSI